ncbi:hypothetical protein BC938DRAFT_483837 [Jimgerdemannia flammicorona]|uniref:Ornithine cyclodeaminase n=1 Tax=Jimgerdemannia flammicorona TaxID=994334 RepID=A0A433QVQ3_9FUNG|nr:hypothetical protein BC938DRAFT_483837 [Jimgerdemannia flammicorona]
MATLNVRILSHSNVTSLLNAASPMSLLELMARTFHTFSNVPGATQVPHRMTVKTDAHKVLFMPSSLQDVGTAIKIVSVPTKGQTSGIPATTLVIDEETGEVKAVVNARALTAVRTAAGSALATLHLSSPTSTHLLIFGSGAQSRSHIDLILAIRPTLTHVTIWNRTAGRLDSMVSELRTLHPSVTFRTIVGSGSAYIASAVRQADIICTCTNTSTPLFNGADVKPGAHLNCVGSYTPDMEEVDQVTVGKARMVVVDSVEACKLEAGEFIREVNEGRRTYDDGWIEIGRLVDAEGKIVEGVVRGVRKEEEDVTIFKSVGISVQDCAIATWVLGRAEELSIGNLVEY